MSDIKAYRCPNCGEMINPRSLKCEYCGTQYERDECYMKPVAVQVVNANVIPLQANRRIYDSDLNNMPANQREDFIKWNIEQISHELAKHIVPYMELRTYKDMATMTTIIGGRIKVVEPDERVRDWRMNL